MKEAVKILKRWLDAYMKDEVPESLITETTRLIKKINTQRFATDKEQMLDWALNEVVNAFCPETQVEKIIYANAAALTNNYLDEEYRKLVSERVKKFILEDGRDALSETGG